MRQRRILGGILVLFVLAMLGLLLLALKDNGPKLPPAVQFPDGSRVAVIKVVYGKQLKFPQGNRWQQAAAQVLPVGLAKRLGLKVETYNNPTDSVLIAIEYTITNGTFYAGPAMPFNFSTGADISDDAGNEYRLSSFLHVGQASNDIIEVFVAPLVSHTATNLTLHLNRSDWGPRFTNFHSEFVLPNPAPRHRSHWTTDRLPVTNQSGDLSVVLSAIEPGTPEGCFVAGGYQITYPQSAAHTQVFERGTISTNWTINGVTIQDEECNVCGLDAHFSPREPRKFRVELLHTFPVGSNDILTLRNLPLADANHSYTPIQTNFGTNIITISRLAPGQITYSIKPGLEHLGCRLTILYTDESGHTFTALKDSPMGPFGANMGFSQKNTNAIKSADIIFTFAATTNRFTEFIALPAPTNSPAK